MLELKTTCTHCQGKGVVKSETIPEPCKECEGEGEVLTEDGHTVANLVYEILDKRQEQNELRAQLLAKRST